MNKTKIEWADFTWNPVTGCYGPEGSKESPNWCPYCYAKKIATRFKGTEAFPEGFKPTFHPDRLLDPYEMKKPSRIFACSMTDLFGPWLPDNWVGEVLFSIGNVPRHTFIILTKSARNLLKWQRYFPTNLWLGITVTEQKDVERISYLRTVDQNVKLISFEPLLGPINVNLEGIDRIIIGAQTNPTRIPKKDWVVALINQARELGISIFLKKNLCWPEKIQEFPGRYIAPETE